MNNKDLKYISNFWEKKILIWEVLRYSRWFYLHPFSWTVRARLNMTIKTILSRGVSSWSVLELGCGSGVLASHISNRFKKYVGVDIASNAISVANEKNKLSHVNFLSQDVLSYPFSNDDLVIFLGLTDWLDEEELIFLFDKIQSSNIFFSYTETRVVSKLNPYWYYRKIVDSKTIEENYKARTYNFQYFNKILLERGYAVEIVQPASIVNPGVLIWAKK